MSDFVHCNACFSVPVSDLRFYFTSCGCLFCKKCTDKGANGNSSCRNCGAKWQNGTSSLIPLDSKLKPEIKDFFEDVVAYLKKAVNIAEYQKKHRSHFLRHVCNENRQLKAQIDKFANDVQDRDKQIERLNQRLADRRFETPLTPHSIESYRAANPGVNFQGNGFPVQGCRSTTPMSLGSSTLSLTPNLNKSFALREPPVQGTRAPSTGYSSMRSLTKTPAMGAVSGYPGFNVGHIRSEPFERSDSVPMPLRVHQTPHTSQRISLRPKMSVTPTFRSGIPPVTRRF